MTNQILFIIFALLGAGILGFSIYKAVKLVKNPLPNLVNYPLEVTKIGYLIAGCTVSFVLMFVFIAMRNAYPLTKGEWAELIFGSLIFAGCTGIALNTFIVHYYGKEIPTKLNKGLYISMISSFVLMFAGLILLTNSFADYLQYPLVNGFNFKTGLTTYQTVKSGGFAIAFYALFILGGAIIVYFVCDHRFFKEYGKHGILESTFYVAFPAGIIGSRIGYVIGEWNTKFASRVAAGEWWAPLAIWEGGLTIIWGALIGIIAGVAWFVTKKKQYSIWLAMDVIVPAILIAQAVGRWGNFFNAEVHGFQVLASQWQILPKIILNQMVYSSTNVIAQAGYIYLPLFLIEGVINLTGYFVIRYAVGTGLKKYIEMGDQAALYLVWYGMTRVLLEPLRDKSFNMGDKGYWSWFWSFFFILGGALLLAANHLVKYLLAKKKGTYIVLKNSFSHGLVFSSIFGGIGLILTIIGIVGMSKSTYVPTLAYNRFNNSLLSLIIGISFLTLLATSIPSLLEGLKTKNE